MKTKIHHFFHKSSWVVLFLARWIQSASSDKVSLKTIFRRVSVRREDSLLLSSRLSACINTAPTGRIFVKFYIANFNKNPQGKSKFG
jgi:hypothetical protein